MTKFEHLSIGLKVRHINDRRIGVIEALGPSHFNIRYSRDTPEAVISLIEVYEPHQSCEFEIIPPLRIVSQ